jgi:hypothetical protein
MTPRSLGEARELIDPIKIETIAMKNKRVFNIHCRSERKVLVSQARRDILQPPQIRGTAMTSINTKSTSKVFYPLGEMITTGVCTHMID